MPTHDSLRATSRLPCTPLAACLWWSEITIWWLSMQWDQHWYWDWLASALVLGLGTRLLPVLFLLPSRSQCRSPDLAPDLTPISCQLLKRRARCLIRMDPTVAAMGSMLARRCTCVRVALEVDPLEQQAPTLHTSAPRILLLTIAWLRHRLGR